MRSISIPVGESFATDIAGMSIVKPGITFNVLSTRHSGIHGQSRAHPV